MSVEGKVLTVHRKAQKCALTPLPTATCATFLLNHDYKYLFHLMHTNHQCSYLYSLLSIANTKFYYFFSLLYA